MQNATGPAFLADCPTRLAVEIISDKWAVLVLFGLSQQPRRHGELAGLIGGISRKVLTQTLRRSSSTVWSNAVPKRHGRSSTASPTSAGPWSSPSRS